MFVSHYLDFSFFPEYETFIKQEPVREKYPYTDCLMDELPLTF